MPNFTQPTYFPVESKELVAYLAAAQAAGYDATVERMVRITCAPRVAVAPLAQGEMGIDVSHWQGDVDWQKVARAGVRFAFMKATEARWLDPYFSRNWAGSRAAGVLRGAYMFFHAGVSAAAQAEFLIETLGTHGTGELRVAVDVEHAPHLGEPRHDEWLENLSRVLASLKEFLGYWPYVYTNQVALNKMFRWRERSTLPPWAGVCPLWVAHYTRQQKPIIPRGWSKYHIWQWDNGGMPWSTAVPGVNGPCDRDRWGGYPEA